MIRDQCRIRDKQNWHECAEFKRPVESMKKSMVQRCFFYGIEVDKTFQFKGLQHDRAKGLPMKRTAGIERATKETQIKAMINLDGTGVCHVETGIGFFDHMLTLFCVHGVFDFDLSASGDIDVDFHHTIEDVGLVLGSGIDKALGDRKGISRYGAAAIPMDDALASVTLDLSNRPFLVFQTPSVMPQQHDFDVSLGREFFRAVAQRAGMNLHITIAYGDNWHHMIEAVFKGFGRALRQAVAFDQRVKGVPSSKGSL
jgi:imidazoleglycerol-phosphate dehydratase